MFIPPLLRFIKNYLTKDIIAFLVIFVKVLPLKRKAPICFTDIRDPGKK